jgi:hypothetical protein
MHKSASLTDLHAMQIKNPVIMPMELLAGHLRGRRQ